MIVLEFYDRPVVFLDYTEDGIVLNILINDDNGVDIFDKTIVSDIVAKYLTAVHHKAKYFGVLYRGI